MAIKEIFLLAFLFASNFQTSLGDDFEYLQRKKIHVFKTKATFLSAYINCTRLEMKMLEINSLNEHYEIVDLMAKYGILNYFWILINIKL